MGAGSASWSVTQDAKGQRASWASELREHLWLRGRSAPRGSALRQLTRPNLSLLRAPTDCVIALLPCPRARTARPTRRRATGWFTQRTTSATKVPATEADAITSACADWRVTADVPASVVAETSRPGHGRHPTKGPGSPCFPEPNHHTTQMSRSPHHTSRSGSRPRSDPRSSEAHGSRDIEWFGDACQSYRGSTAVQSGGKGHA